MEICRRWGSLVARHADAGGLAPAQTAHPLVTVVSCQLSLPGITGRETDPLGNRAGPEPWDQRQPSSSSVKRPISPPVVEESDVGRLAVLRTIVGGSQAWEAPLPASSLVCRAWPARGSCRRPKKTKMAPPILVAARAGPSPGRTAGGGSWAGGLRQTWIRQQCLFSSAKWWGLPLSEDDNSGPTQQLNMCAFFSPCGMCSPNIFTGSEDAAPAQQTCT